MDVAPLDTTKEDFDLAFDTSAGFTDRERFFGTFYPDVPDKPLWEGAVPIVDSGRVWAALQTLLGTAPEIVAERGASAISRLEAKADADRAAAVEALKGRPEPQNPRTLQWKDPGDAYEAALLDYYEWLELYEKATAVPAFPPPLGEEGVASFQALSRRLWAAMLRRGDVKARMAWADTICRFAEKWRSGDYMRVEDLAQLQNVVAGAEATPLDATLANTSAWAFNQAIREERPDLAIWTPEERTAMLNKPLVLGKEGIGPLRAAMLKFTDAYFRKNPATLALRLSYLEAVNKLIATNTTEATDQDVKDANRLALGFLVREAQFREHGPSGFAAVPAPAPQVPRKQLSLSLGW